MPKKEKSMKNSNRGKTMEKRDLLEKEGDDQVYGVVGKAMGGSVFEISCFDGKTRKCMARQSKKKMPVESGSICIVGIRTFSSNDNIGDIIYVYDHDEARTLRKMGEIPSDIDNSSSSTCDTIKEEGFDFADI